MRTKWSEYAADLPLYGSWNDNRFLGSDMRNLSANNKVYYDTPHS